MSAAKDTSPLASNISKSDQYDLENQQTYQGRFALNLDESENWEKRAQLGFIRKVFGIVTVQLVFTCCFVALAMVWDTLTQFLYQNQWLIIPALIISLGVIFPLLCYPQIAKEVPTNFIMLFIFTFGETVAVACVCVYYDPQTVFAAVLMAAGVTFALTAYSFWTERDFSQAYAGMWVVISALTLTFLFFWIFGSSYQARMVNFVIQAYCCLGVIIYGFYIIVDIQLIIGKGRQRLTYDDYILGALMLYLDIINLFLHILRMLGNKR